MNSAASVPSLRSLLADCTVRITTASDSGTGVFVGEGLVLTCAHVVGEARLARDAPMVRWRDAEAAAEYVAVLPEPSPQFGNSYPYPDLALLRVPFGGHPCALLGTDEPMDDDRAYSWGYPLAYERGDPVSGLVYEGLTGGGEPFLKLSGAQVTEGMSGAPVLNLRSGAVEAIIKRTRGEDAALGARGIPVATILDRLPQLVAAQAGYFSHDHRWGANMTPWQRWLAKLEVRAGDVENKVTGKLRGFSDDKLAAALALLPPRNAQEAPAGLAEALTPRLFDTTLPVLKAITAEKLGPYPQWNALDIYEIVGPYAWVTIPATERLRKLIDESLEDGTRPVAVLNMADGATGVLYVRYASGTYPLLPNTWRVAVWQRDPEETTEEDLAASLTAAVNAAMRPFVPGSQLYNHFTNTNPVVVVVPPPVPDAGLVARLRREQPRVFFLLLAGSDAREAVATLAASPALQVVYLEPEGDPRLEEAWAIEFRVTQLALKEP